MGTGRALKLAAWVWAPALVCLTLGSGLHPAELQRLWLSLGVTRASASGRYPVNETAQVKPPTQPSLCVNIMSA